LRDLVVHDGFADFCALAFDLATFAGGVLPAVQEMVIGEDGDRPMTGVSSARSGEDISPIIDGDGDEYELEERSRRGVMLTGPTRSRPRARRRPSAARTSA
jgi:hypothetical protein